MTTTGSDELRFNALTDPWLPLVQAGGGTVWASPVEVLCGEKDGVDLDYPRDDFRVYGRLLLSALVQALFPARDKAELSERLAKPLARSVVEARIAPVLGDFDLFGPTPFLQVTAPAKPPDKGAAPFVFPGEDLFRAPVSIAGVSLPVAVVMLFIEQTYAGGAGRGYGAGPGGQPGALTLVDPGTVRTGAWANSLTTDRVLERYAKEEDRPWSNEARTARPRASLGIVAGLFFQPRAVWLVPSGTGPCTFTGAVGPLVLRSPLLSKSALTKKAPGKEDLWQHPCAPLAVNSQGIGAVRLSAERPAWTGLAQLLDPISRDRTKVRHPSEGPAPVLQQWRGLSGRPLRPRLLVLDFDRDKANVKRRFFEGFPLTERLMADKETVEAIRDLARDAQDVRQALVKSLTRAHDTRKHGGLALADAESAYWGATEEPFLHWLEKVAVASDASDNELAEARAGMGRAIRRSALAIFDEHVSLSEFDPRKAEQVAGARRTLRRALYPKQPRTPATAPATEVTP